MHNPATNPNIAPDAPPRRLFGETAALGHQFKITLAVPDTMQMEFWLGDDRRENPDAVRFERFLRTHPHYLEQLVAEARLTVEEFSSWSILHAIEQVRFRHGKGPSHDYGPALARKIAELHPELGKRCQMRHSKFGA